jgi:hypothetical protein
LTVKVTVSGGVGGVVNSRVGLAVGDVNCRAVGGAGLLELEQAVPIQLRARQRPSKLSFLLIISLYIIMIRIPFPALPSMPPLADGSLIRAAKISDRQAVKRFPKLCGNCGLAT